MNLEVVKNVVSKSGLVAIGDFVATSERQNKEKTVTYHSAKVLVGDSTLEFDIEPVTAGKASTIKKYSRVLVAFEQVHFAKSNMTINKAKEIVIVE